MRCQKYQKNSFSQIILWFTRVSLLTHNCWRWRNYYPNLLKVILNGFITEMHFPLVHTCFWDRLQNRRGHWYSFSWNKPKWLLFAIAFSRNDHSGYTKTSAKFQHLLKYWGRNIMIKYSSRHNLFRKILHTPNTVCTYYISSTLSRDAALTSNHRTSQ